MLKSAALALAFLSSISVSTMRAAEPVTVPSGSGWRECPTKDRKQTQPGCVHDGDTFWFSGSKYRLACINAVELSTANGIKARDLLISYLNKPGTTITDIRTQDQYKRELAIVSGFDQVILSKGLAVDPDYRDARAFCRKNK